MTNVYDKLIIRNAEKFDVPAALIKAMIAQESNFDPSAVSPAGARGLMQIMPATAVDMNAEPDELYEPDINIECGAKYLRYQFDQFPEIGLDDDRWKFSLAAYNGGRGYVNRALYLARRSVMDGEMSGTRAQQWEHVYKYLKSDQCRVNGRRPDADQMIFYVNHIWYHLLPEAQATLTPSDHAKRGRPNVA